ncbi:MAG: SH3 domain-containing protein [Bacteroidales bacterium]|jgi:hypothetical protein|nr:SH3 domain-containing protein [Bacteroidales bacterium]
MYVNVIDGLYHRSSPQISSEKIGLLTFGEEITVFERSNIDTIDGITDYWYKTQPRVNGSSKNEWSWVFGGFLSDKMPFGVEPVFGYWDSDLGYNFYWFFSPRNFFYHGLKGPGLIRNGGNWELSGNILTLIDPSHKMYLITEITVIDRDNIIFTHSDGTVEKITRMDYLDTFFL